MKKYTDIHVQVDSVVDKYLGENFYKKSKKAIQYISVITITSMFLLCITHMPCKGNVFFLKQQKQILKKDVSFRS